MFIPETLKESKHKMSFRDTCQIIHGYQYITIKDNRAVIDCRIYAGKRPGSNRIIAAIWICDNKNKLYSHGVGIATGYGYHKGSLAIELALREMGIKPDESIGCRGYETCIEAFNEIMICLGHKEYVTAEFHA